MPHFVYILYVILPVFRPDLPIHPSSGQVLQPLIVLHPLPHPDPPLRGLLRSQDVLLFPLRDQPHVLVLCLLVLRKIPLGTALKSDIRGALDGREDLPVAKPWIVTREWLLQM